MCRSLHIFSYVLSTHEGKYLVNTGTLLNTKVRGELFVSLNKMFYEHRLDVDDPGNVCWPVHLYIHTNILKIRFLLGI